LLETSARILTASLEGGLARGTRRQYLARGVAGLLAARLDPPAEEPAADEALLDLLVPGLILTDLPGLPGAEVLRGHLDRYLGHLLSADAFKPDPEGPWRHLLLDEMLRRPPTDLKSDPRYRACLELSWARWVARREWGGYLPAALVGLLRLLSWHPRITPPTPAWQQSLLTRVVPDSLQGLATKIILSDWLPPLWKPSSIYSREVSP